MHVARLQQHQDVPSVSDVAAPDIQLSVCERMLSHVKAHLLQGLALRFVDRDSVTWPEWELPPFHGHTTPGQREANTIRGRRTCLHSGDVSTVTNFRSTSLTIPLVLFIARSWMEMLRITKHRQFSFSISW